MPAAFTSILAAHIDKLGVLPCIEAHDGARLQPGRILLAPGDRHMLVRREGAGFCVRLSDGPAVNFCRPAVDPMLASACEAAAGRVLAVMVQDEATSVVWGMPGAVARAGLAHAILPLPQIGPKIAAMLGVRR
jgi:two-component system chemotaxis response regulator CheB